MTFWLAPIILARVSKRVKRTSVLLLSSQKENKKGSAQSFFALCGRHAGSYKQTFMVIHHKQCIMYHEHESCSAVPPYIAFMYMIDTVAPKTPARVGLSLSQAIAKHGPVGLRRGHFIAFSFLVVITVYFSYNKWAINVSTVLDDHVDKKHNTLSIINHNNYEYCHSNNIVMSRGDGYGNDPGQDKRTYSISHQTFPSVGFVSWYHLWFS